ncbi:MAG: hypothetical protein HQL84_00215 [Magnetococcales bacterium]|nr:hypothetical protein [Magnetococcales bacterium]MBF0148452.1 hypothetical protein [Magnetococcales bacterium]
MRIFVSYTLRDGKVTDALLQRLNVYLRGICTPFIHAIEQPKIKVQQLSVFRALFLSHLIYVIDSPAINDSPWVRLELLIGRILLRPMVHFQVEELDAKLER